MDWGIRGALITCSIWLLLLGGALFAENPAPAPPVFGRYAGFLNHKMLGMDQLATLDFIASRQENNKLHLSAVLKLAFGDYTSREYVSYHFDDVEYDLVTGTLVFDQPDADATFIIRKFTGQTLVANFRSQLGRIVGELSLSSVQLPERRLPLIEPLAGEYEGICPGNKKLNSETHLQLYTYRSNLDASRTGGSYGAYHIKGRLDQDGLVEINFSNGSYDFFFQTLTLYGERRQWVCQIDANGMVCNKNCRLKRISALPNPRELTPTAFPLPEQRAQSNAADPNAARALEGQYYGYVHHDFLNQYQEGALNILTYQAKTNDGEKKLTLSADAALFFDGRNNPMEAITYHFDPRPALPLIGSSHIVFSQPSRDTDAVIQLTSISNGILKGVWYSLRFGRVGEFEFWREDLGTPPLPAGAVVVQSLTGLYESTAFDLALRTILGRTTNITANPFAPLELGGNFYLKGVGPFGGKAENAVELAHPSTGPADGVASSGTYDIYTGRLAIEIGGLTLVGTNLPERKKVLNLVGHTPVSARRPNSSAPSPFRYRGEWRDLNSLRYGQGGMDERSTIKPQRNYREVKVTSPTPLELTLNVNFSFNNECATLIPGVEIALVGEVIENKVVRAYLRTPSHITGYDSNTLQIVYGYQKIDLNASELSSIQLYQDHSKKLWLQRFQISPRLIGWMFVLPTWVEARRFPPVKGFASTAGCYVPERLATLSPLPMTTFELSDIDYGVLVSYSQDWKLQGKLDSGAPYTIQMQLMQREMTTH